MQHDFFGQRVLIAEDNFLLAADLASRFSAANAAVVGPCATLADAMGCVDGVDLAVLDVDLRGRMAFPLADWLMRNDVPFVFYTGFDRAMLPERFCHIDCLTKPTNPQTLIAVMAQSSFLRAETVAELLPVLRMRARKMITDRHAADRLVEQTLRCAVAELDSKPIPDRPGLWLSTIMERLARNSLGQMLH